MTAYRGFIVLVSLTVVLLRPSPAAAQLSSKASSSADGSIAPGQKVTVTTADGRKIKGRVLGISPTTLDIGEGEVITSSVAIADVRRVQAADSVKNGVIVGAFSLGLAGFLAGSVADAGNAVGAVFGNSLVVLLGGQPEPMRHTKHYLTGAVAGVTFGALLGFALDDGKQKTIYTSEAGGMTVGVRPLVSEAGKGFGVQVRW